MECIDQLVMEFSRGKDARTDEKVVPLGHQVRDEITVYELEAMAGKIKMEKRGYHRWAWLIVFLLGGLLMVYGGVQDLLLFFDANLAPVPSWHPTPPMVGLICGLIVLASAAANLVWGWQLRLAEGGRRQLLARRAPRGSRQRRGHGRRLDQRLLWLWQPDGLADRRLDEAERTTASPIEPGGRSERDWQPAAAHSPSHHHRRFDAAAERVSCSRRILVPIPDRHGAPLAH